MTLGGARAVVGALAFLGVLVLGAPARAAGDPAGDARPCLGGRPASGSPPDLRSAAGSIIERERGLKFVLTFARPLRVPDTSGHPFRVDVVLRDPRVPAASFGYYRGVNRILRYDAIPQPRIDIILIPERAQNVFDAVTVNGRTLTLEIPGRTITLDRDFGGLGLDRIRWGVIVRDGSACDFLGDGRATHALVVASASEAPIVPDRLEASAGISRAVQGLLIAGAIGVLAIGVAAFVWVRRPGH